jgi:8-oxo-dGDP phosphatase
MTGSSQGFRHLGETLIFQNPIFRLMDVTFAAPDGEQFTRQIVRHPGAVGVVPITAAGEVILVKQFRGAIGTETIEIPAGLLDVEGEDLEMAARRELREEIGMTAGSLVHLIAFQAAVGFTDERITVFVARDLTDVGVELHGPEEQHMTILRVPLDEAKAMARRGELVDVKTALAVLLV